MALAKTFAVLVEPVQKTGNEMVTIKKSCSGHRDVGATADQGTGMWPERKSWTKKKPTTGRQ